MTIVGDTDLLHQTADAIPNAFTWPPPPTENAADILWLEPDPAATPPASVPEQVPEHVPDQVPAADASDGITVSYLLSAGISFEWQDVVALVQELGAQLKDAKPSGNLVALDAITLEADGRLRVKLDTGTVPIVSSLGHVLQQLLIDQPSPANLRLLALQANSDASSFGSVEDLRSALAKFERPGRRKTIAGLYERAQAIRRPIPIQAVPAKIERVPETPAPAIVHEPPEKQTKKRPPPARQWRIAGIVLGTVAVAVTAMVFVIRGRSEPVSAPQAAVDRLLQAVPDGDVSEPPSNNGLPGEHSERLASAGKSAPRAVDSPVRLPAPAAASPAAGAPALGESASVAEAAPTIRQQAASPISGNAEEEFRRAQALFDKKEYLAAAAAFQRVIALVSNQEPTPSSSILRSTANDMAALSRAGLLSTGDARVYTTLDKGVVEPVPLGQYFPEEPGPGAVPGEPSTLELLIDTRGIVESVRLRNPLNRYRDKWWLPASKTWRFQPAMKDGHPVKFLKRIMISPIAPSPSDP